MANIFSLFYVVCNVADPTVKWPYSEGYAVGDTPLTVARRHMENPLSKQIVEFLEGWKSNSRQREEERQDDRDGTQALRWKRFDTISLDRMVKDASSEVSSVVRKAQETLTFAIFEFIERYFIQELSGDIDSTILLKIYNQLKSAMRHTFGHLLPAPTNSEMVGSPGFDLTSSEYCDKVDVKEGPSIFDLFELFYKLIDSETETDACQLIACLDMAKLSSYVLASSGNTLLHVVCGLRKVRVAIKMLKMGFTSSQMVNGKYPIHYLLESEKFSETHLSAAERELYTEVYDLLLRDVDTSYSLPKSESTKGESLLHSAISANAVSLVTILLSQDADIYAVNAEGVTVFEESVRCSDESSGIHFLKLLFDRLKMDEVEEYGYLSLRSGWGLFFFTAFSHSATHTHTCTHTPKCKNSFSFFLLVSLALTLLLMILSLFSLPSPFSISLSLSLFPSFSLPLSAVKFNRPKVYRVVMKHLLSVLESVYSVAGGFDVIAHTTALGKRGGEREGGRRRREREEKKGGNRKKKLFVLHFDE